MSPRLLADENSSHRSVKACERLARGFPIMHIADLDRGAWLGLDDVALLMACKDAGFILLGFDRATLAWHATQMLRVGEDFSGLILFRRTIASTDYGRQSRLLVDFWQDAPGWDWINRIVYLPKSP